MPSAYPPLNLVVRTPRLELRGATDELLEALVPVVRAGLVDAGAPLPFDDPMSLYAEGEERVWRWMRAIWSGRGHVDDDWWRLYFAVVVRGEPLGVQDITAPRFTALRTVNTFSWLAPRHRRQGLGKEMRAAILHLAFAGLDAIEARSDGFVDNEGSNGVSRALGYEPDGTDWATRQGEPALLNRWRLTRARWELARRNDIELIGVEPCLPVLGVPPPM